MTDGPLPVDPGGLPPDGGHPHVLVGDVGAPVLDDAEVHHLGRVRRLRDGDVLTVTDGAGSWRWCRWRGGPVEAAGDVVAVPAPRPALTVAFALTKGVKPDWTVQKLVELGVDRIVPFRAARSVVRWDAAKAADQVDRLGAIARAAAQQSRRCWAPVVADVADVAEVAAMGAVLMERGHQGPSLAHNVFAVGPEGGFSDAERELFTQCASLGPTILRAETAAVTTGALLVALRSGLVAEHPPEVHAR